MTHAGVLVAIPALVAGGLLSTVEKIYGSLGPAFYGLRTTLVACVSVGPAEDSSSRGAQRIFARGRSEEHTSELQSRVDLVCRLLLEKKKKNNKQRSQTTSEKI